MPQDSDFSQTVKINLFELTNEELHHRLLNRAADERRLTHQILQLIAEVDQRKLYLPMAQASLFDYLVTLIGYTPASAQRRIDAARMMQQVTEVGSKIENGSLKLSQVSQVQKVLRLVRKTDNIQLLSNEKKDLLAKLENKTGVESELILAQEFKLPPQTQFRQKIQQDESVRIELTLSKEQIEIVERAKALLSHALPGATLAEVIVSLAERYVRTRVGAKSRSKDQSETKMKTETETNAEAWTKTSIDQGSTSAPEGTERQRRGVSKQAIPAAIKKNVLSRNQGCEFRDAKTGRVCGSKMFLEVDHVQPRFAGGGNEPFNLRPMCSSHNKFRYTAGY
ncbi:MAG: HNH endonuclease [Bdellovibrionaceae bacterium]|nr:HNH endonuclease [Pseudobdellovibrionaceae bacterium]